MTWEMVLVFAVLGVTVFLFMSEWLRVDVVALLVMVTLPWLGLVDASEALAGLSSNAVISIIGVMILSAGVDRSGIMSRLAQPLLHAARGSERRLVSLISAAVGGISAFMQNIGAAALFLPAMLRVSKRTGIPASRLLMPVGFAAILGGTLTMVASGPLIILNDLLQQGGHAAFGLFAVTPVGLLLLAGGIVYFALFGRLVLPSRSSADDALEGCAQQELISTWELPATIHTATVRRGGQAEAKTLDELNLWNGYRVNLLLLRSDRDVQHAPWRQTQLTGGQQLALLGEEDDVRRLAVDLDLQLDNRVAKWAQPELASANAGFAELVVRPRAPIAGQPLREVALRKRFAVEPLALLTGASQRYRDFSDTPLHPGDALVVHGRWESIRLLARDPSFVLLTPAGEAGSKKSSVLTASLCFLGAIGLAIAGFPLAICLLSGAVAMVLLRVLSIDDAYRAVDWRTVFLLAGLIPLGTAMTKSGAAAYVAETITGGLGASPVLLVMTAVGLLSTFFSLFMSNVAATVLLAPLAMIIGDQSGVDGRALALLVAICASNSFLLPTHQVNALFMSPGGYRNADYLRAGGIMSVLFLVIAVLAVWHLFVR